ncbi:hypothetical protein [Streptomyces sp. NBC_01304]|uniref:hypothetical protein n=1 Tax=Streptomyces sp. NBC_01304 TaxID=2903818 RepID=UPI002E0FC0DF|nr:hypothetical protein OG430_04205 [Streptomyces sp. NBC_01304]
MNDPGFAELLSRCGLEVLEVPLPDSLPAPRRAAGITFGGSEPAATVPFNGPHLGARVDEAWLRIAHEQQLVDGQGRFLITTGMEGPWVPVRLQGDLHLAEHLVGANARPGHAEFITMALDGSVMCGVTTEEYDVWLVVDRDRIRQPLPPPPDIEAARAATRRRLELEERYAPERLTPPLDDGWVLLAFDRHTVHLKRLHEIPDDISQDLLPDALGTAVPGTAATPRQLTESQAQALGDRLGIPVEDRRFGYFVEFQHAAVKSRQSQRRAIAPDLLA